MKQEFIDFILDSLKVKSILASQTIQSLWSGYGEIIRLKLDNNKSIIVKHIKLPKKNNHPRGWNTNKSHQRKIKSYQIEINWYKNWSFYTNDLCKVPNLISEKSIDNEHLIILEDLDEIGFDIRKTSLKIVEVKYCLNWLANFHAQYIFKKPIGLWNIGTYWHFDTRPDEYNVMSNFKLKRIAKTIDYHLNSSSYLTFVHGDAKVANFCFSSKEPKVSAVDFQYVGGGCGIKDVVYFLGSCLSEKECFEYEIDLLDYYFKELRLALNKTNCSINLNDLENDWRYLYDFAWTDFYRFLNGWEPNHKKVNKYTEKVFERTLDYIDKNDLNLI